ncbi:MAG: SDR family NAD(P)-dependent oxidoreductase [Crocinitomicaceae bacterium]
MTSKKVIVVLGASRGIGAATVQLLAKNFDHEIIALSRNGAKMQEQFGALSNVHSYTFDLAGSDVRKNAEQIFSHFDRIDILINNAGTLVNKPFTELTHNDIASSYQVNVIGVMEVTQAAVGKMTEAHIVNISSVGGFQGSVKFPGLSAYSTSKAALCSFTELFAEEYKNTSIKMNCLCLGAVQTEMLEEAFPGYEAPLSAEEMAAYIVDFSLNANKWMNGKIIPVSLSTP